MYQSMAIVQPQNICGMFLRTRIERTERPAINQSERRDEKLSMINNSSTVVLNHITKSFGEFTAVKELSLTVRAGRVFGLLGPNGAGKTTTIRMIVNITAPDSGTISLFGRKIDSELQNRIGYLPEERGLYRRMRVGDQMRFFAELKNVRGK